VAQLKTQGIFVSAEEKVAFLSRWDSYPEGARHVEIKETHMSWVFLTDGHAWKLKKPSRFDHLDLRNVEARRRNCDEEVRLNRRLALDVYRGVVPLTVGAGGRLQLDQPGVVDDWLVCMRRLPEDRMLDQAIERRALSNEDLRRIGNLLARFYSNAEHVSVATDVFAKLLADELRSSREELRKHKEALNAELIEWAAGGALGFIERHFSLLDERVRAAKIVEGHGDLRAEHICLENEPVIIDCLEFSRNLRIVDPASELMFLRLECERLGAPAAGALIFDAYCAQTGDDPPEQLLEFYRTYHAAVRARIAISHLNDCAVRDPQKWIQRAGRFLEMAAAGSSGRNRLFMSDSF
jgi:aminoglycoside phosphotransferase family enzyme